MSIYTNEALYNDIVKMLDEVNNPKDPITARLLREAEPEFKKADQSGSDECVDHFIKKYPLLALNCPKIFREAILINKEFDVNMVKRALNYGESMETGSISKTQAAEAFGKELAKRFYPEMAYAEVKQNLNDPHKAAKVRKRLTKAMLEGQNNSKEIKLPTYEEACENINM